MKMFVDVPAVYLCAAPIDFRKSINGLAALVEDELDMSSLSGAIFLFCNKNRDKLKLLYWDETGFALWYKRLDRNKFIWPKIGTASMSLNEEQLHLLLTGFSVIGHEKIDVQGKRFF